MMKPSGCAWPSRLVLVAAGLAVVWAAPAWSAPAAGAPAAARRQQVNDSAQIRMRGYQTGYTAERADAQQGSLYDFQSHVEYSAGNQGYSGSTNAELQNDRVAYRAGFENGYDDGYYGRANEPNSQPARTFAGTPAANPSNPGLAAATPAAQQGNVTSATVAATLATGTVIKVKLENTLSANSSRAGDPFSATVTEPVLANTGQAVIPTGSAITGQVAHVQAASGMSGTSELQLRFQQLRLPDGRTFAISASVSGVGNQGGVGHTVSGGAKANNEGGVQQSRGRQTAGETAAGGAVGAVLGAVVGGGKGAAIGAIAGGGLGAVVSSKGKTLNLPAGTPLTISLTQPVTIR